MKNPYAAEGAEDMISPCPIYYEDGIRRILKSNSDCRFCGTFMAPCKKP